MLIRVLCGHKIQIKKKITEYTILTLEILSISPEPKTKYGKKPLLGKYSIYKLNTPLI